MMRQAKGNRVLALVIGVLLPCWTKQGVKLERRTILFMAVTSQMSHRFRFLGRQTVHNSSTASSRYSAPA
ncbi:MAG TPA: hypothetical protein VFS38_05050 [Actinomycetota bacterium]|nr:hypothetical protein [Actinomycetota bacterium]